MFGQRVLQLISSHGADMVAGPHVPQAAVTPVAAPGALRDHDITNTNQSMLPTDLPIVLPRNPPKRLRPADSLELRQSNVAYSEGGLQHPKAARIVIEDDSSQSLPPFTGLWTDDDGDDAAGNPAVDLSDDDAEVPSSEDDEEPSN